MPNRIVREGILASEKLSLVFVKLVCEEPRKGITNAADKWAENRIKRFFKGESVPRRERTPLEEVLDEER